MFKETFPYNPQPEITNRLRFFIEQTSKPLDFNEVIGIHGTSLHTIFKGIQTGKIPGSTPYVEDASDMKDLYFFPSQIEQGRLPLSFQLQDVNSTMPNAIGYAQEVSFGHVLLHSLGLSEENRDMKNAARALFTYHEINLEQELSELDDRIDKKLAAKIIMGEIETYEEALDIFESVGIPKHQVLQCLPVARQFKGVLIGLHPRVMDKYQILAGDNNESDLRFRSKDGLDFEDILGCEVIGDMEREIIREIRQKLSS